MLASRLLDPAVPHAAVLDVVRRGWQRMVRAQYALSLALRRLFRDNVHRGAGYARFDDWAEAELGMPGRVAWRLSLLGRDLERLPRTREAVERGEIPFTKVCEFARVATAGDEAEWIAFARVNTFREIERRARRSATGEASVRRVVSRLDARGAQAARAAREKLGRALDRIVAEEELLPALARLYVEGTLAPAGEEPRPAGRPYLALHLCPSCLDTWAPLPGENLRVPVEAWLGALRDGAEVTSLLGDELCGCATAHRRDVCPAERPGRDAAARARGSSAAAARPRGATDEADGPGGPTDGARRSRGTPDGAPSGRHVPGAVRAVVEARDGFRCRVPGCGSAGPLELSHLVPFAASGPMTPENVVQHCATHNALLASGRLRVEGQAPFERYYLADGTFLGVGYDPVPRRGSTTLAGRRRSRAPVPGGAAACPPRPVLQPA